MGKKRTQKKQGNIGPLILIGVGALLLLAVAALLISRGGQNPGEEQAAGQIQTPAVGAVERVSLEDSKAAFDNQEAVFLDVRDPTQFQAGHIPGAVNIPLAQLESQASTLDPNQWIITYCT